MTMSLADLLEISQDQNSPISPSDVESLAHLFTGSIHGPILLMGWQDAWVVFFVDSMEALTDEEVHDMFYEEFVLRLRQTLFMELAWDVWLPEADIRWNDRGVRSIWI